jgi:hypothetical protein
MDCGAIGKNPQYYTPRINARLGKIHHILLTEGIDRVDRINQRFGMQIHEAIIVLL